MTRAIIWVALVLLIVACRPAARSTPPASSTPIRPTTAAASTAEPAVAAVTATTQPPALAPTGTAAPTATPPATTSPRPTTTAAPTASPTPCPPGEVRSGVFDSGLAGESRYRVYLPPCYGLDGRLYPAVYLFAGNAQDESAWDAYGLDEAAEEAIRAGEIPPMLLVMADGGWLANTTSGGPRSYEAHVLDFLIPHIEATYCVWPEPAGRAIGGISRGGYWALEIAFRHPELFVSAGGHSPALIDSHAGPEVNPQFTALSNDLGDLRIYIDIGADDYLLPNTLRLHEDMVEAGIPHTWTLNAGAHEDSYWPEHLDEYLRWYGEPWPVARGRYPAGCAGVDGQIQE